MGCRIGCVICNRIWVGDDDFCPFCENKQLKDERIKICQHLVGRDDCKDLPDVILEVLEERAQLQKYTAELKDVVDKLEHNFSLFINLLSFE